MLVMQADCFGWRGRGGRNTSTPQHRLQSSTPASLPSFFLRMSISCLSTTFVLGPHWLRARHKPVRLVDISGMPLGWRWVGGGEGLLVVCRLLAHDACVLREYHHVVYDKPTNVLTTAPFSLHPPPHLHRMGNQALLKLAACGAWDWQGAGDWTDAQRRGRARRISQSSCGATSLPYLVAVCACVAAAVVVK